MKDTVREWRISRREVFLPLSHPPGEAQVDFGQATVRIAGKETKVALFVMTLPYSGAIFVQANAVTPSPNPEPFLVRESSSPVWGLKGFSDEEATQCRADCWLASAG